MKVDVTIKSALKKLVMFVVSQQTNMSFCARRKQLGDPSHWVTFCSAVLV